MTSLGAIAISFAGFLAVVFTAFFFWNRLALKSDGDAWSASLVGTLLATALFIVCFAIGVWFSIARLRGQGWILSA